MSSFKHFDLKLLSPSFESDLVDIQTELEKLRYLRIHTDVHPFLFSQLKHIFHMLESLGSARIEGNHTTLADYIDSKVVNGHLKVHHYGHLKVHHFKNGF